MLLTSPQHFASSATQYRAFCETLIQRLHHTATKIHQSDQCAVGDRPYTPSYFADLANHIRRYAAILLVHEKHKVERASGMSPPWYVVLVLRSCIYLLLICVTVAPLPQLVLSTSLARHEAQ